MNEWRKKGEEKEKEGKRRWKREREEGMGVEKRVGKEMGFVWFLV